MKVNRFGMSQPVFVKMVEHWFNTQLHIAQALRFTGSKEKALQTLAEVEVIVGKTFRDEEPPAMREHRATLARLREEINLELFAPEEASVLSS